MTAATATQLRTTDLVLAGHGFGEAPAFVVNASRFTARLAVVTLTDGPDRTRTVKVAADHTFEVGPRPGDQLAGLDDYDFARDNRTTA